MFQHSNIRNTNNCFLPFVLTPPLWIWFLTKVTRPWKFFGPGGGQPFLPDEVAHQAAEKAGAQ